MPFILLALGVAALALLASSAADASIASDGGGDPGNSGALGADMAPSVAGLLGYFDLTSIAPDSTTNTDAIDMSQQYPRGIANNNPGNIVKSAIAWRGKVAGVDSRFETFDTPENGIRALARNLQSYQRVYGLNTVRQIINKWAPPSENNTAAYVAAVAGECGVGPDQAINTGDPAMLAKLTTAIIRHENGTVPYSAAMIQGAVIG